MEVTGGAGMADQGLAGVGGGFGQNEAPQFPGVSPPGLPAASVGSKGFGPGLDGSQFGKGKATGPGDKSQEEPTMHDLLSEMRGMRLSLDTKFTGLSTQLQDLKQEIAEMKSDMVTKEVFQNLEERVATLEVGGLANPDFAWLQQQVGRMDPANRSLAFTGFVEKDLGKRRSLINSYMDHIGCEQEIRSMDHIWTGPIGNRSVGPITIVEVASRNVREEILKKLKETTSTRKDAAGGNISVGRAKTSLQLKRNGALKQAMKLVKQDARAEGKSVEICWLTEGSKDRTVKIGDQVVFRQTSTDIAGEFVAPFQNIRL